MSNLTLLEVYDHDYSYIKFNFLPLLQQSDEQQPLLSVFINIIKLTVTMYPQIPAMPLATFRVACINNLYWNVFYFPCKSCFGRISAFHLWPT